MSSLSEFDRDYAQELLYPPTPAELADRRRQRSNPSIAMYGSFLLPPFAFDSPIETNDISVWTPGLMLSLLMVSISPPCGLKHLALGFI